MQDFTFVDETFDINLTQSYFLSIQANLNGLSFCILDPVRNKYLTLVHKNFSKELVFDEFLNAVEEYTDSCELLNQKFKTVKLLWISPKNALIPNELFEKERLKKNFELTQKLDELDEIHYFKLKHIEATSVFAVPNQFASIFTRKFKKIQFYNQQITFIDYINLKYHTDISKISVNVHNEFIDIAVVEHGNFKFYNNFHYKSNSDILYYIMYVINQFKLNTHSTELFISGLVDKKSTILKDLKKFIHTIKFHKLPEDFTYSYTFSEIPHHTFINLFSLQLCE